jgi:WD40 repeat protein
VGDVETDTLTITADGKIYAGNDNGDLYVIVGERSNSVSAHSAGIKRIAVNPSNTRLASISYDRKLMIWSISPDGSLSLLNDVLLDYQIWPRSCAFADENTLVFGTFGSTYATFDLTTATWNTSRVQPTHGVNYACVIDESIYSIGDSGILKKDGKPIQHIKSLCNFVSQAGPIIFTGGQNGTLYNALTGESYYQYVAPLNCAVALDRSDKFDLLVGTYTGDILFFEVSKKEGKVQFVKTERWHENAIKGLASSARYVFSVCASGISQVRDVRTLERTFSYRNEDEEVMNACVSLHEKGFASVGRDRKLRVWSVNNPNQCEVIDTCHTHSIKSLAASADGNRVATGSYNGMFSIYDCQSKVWIFHERLTHAGISSINNSSVGFIASSYDGNVFEIIKKGDLYAAV